MLNILFLFCFFFSFWHLHLIHCEPLPHSPNLGGSFCMPFIHSSHQGDRFCMPNLILGDVLARPLLRLFSSSTSSFSSCFYKPPPRFGAVFVCLSLFSKTFFSMAFSLTYSFFAFLLSIIFSVSFQIWLAYAFI